jgi:hypothetical protein
MIAESFKLAAMAYFNWLLHFTFSRFWAFVVLHLP